MIFRLTVLALIAGLLSGCQPTPEALPPNIILIMADDLGYGDLGSYGQEKIQTPHLDRLAAEGIRFTDHYAGSTVCAPSRCVLMTGLHTGHCRVRGNGVVPLEPEDVTVAEVLQEAGYTTGMIGKWGLGEAGSTGAPNQQGFDYFFGFLNQIRAHNFYTDYVWRNEEQVPLDNVIEIAQETYAKGIGSYAMEKNTYVHDLFTQETLEFVTQHQDDPFFLYLPYTIPHANNEAHLGDEHGLEVPDYGPYETEDWPEADKGFAAMVTRMDHDIGRLIFLLDELGLSERTLILFTSDNGPHREGWREPEFFQSSGALRGIKRDLYEGGIRVPLIARWPGTIERDQTSAHVSGFWDFLATAIDLTDSESPVQDGISFLPTLLGQEQPVHEYLYWEFHEGSGPKQAIRAGNYKAVHFWRDDRTELYDLSNDLGEQMDLAPRQPELVDSLFKLMQGSRTPHEVWKIPAQ